MLSADGVSIYYLNFGVTPDLINLVVTDGAEKATARMIAEKAQSNYAVC